MTLTLEEGTDLPPSSNAPLAAVLAQGHLQEEDWDATAEEEDEVGHKERSWWKDRQSLSCCCFKTLSLPPASPPSPSFLAHPRPTVSPSARLHVVRDAQGMTLT